MTLAAAREHHHPGVLSGDLGWVFAGVGRQGPDLTPLGGEALGGGGDPPALRRVVGALGVEPSGRGPGQGVEGQVERAVVAEGGHHHVGPPVLVLRPLEGLVVQRTQDVAAGAVGPRPGDLPQWGGALVQAKPGRAGVGHGMRM